ncbi:MAG: beta-ketoacyl-[acyl-carrier-protein] synthase family protein [Thermoguttaceae bacterium]|nr:beta-ketoacyl-[acyl-carrier-protein] synthase family protein [Thermoguttaceae bacterium]
MINRDSQRRVVVTGMSAISALGLTLEDLRRGLQEGRSGVRSTAENESFPTTLVAPVDDFSGQIQDFGNLDDAKKKAIRKGLKLMAREIQLGVAAAQRALEHANFCGAYASPRVGVAFASDYIVTAAHELVAAMAACRTRDENGQWRFDAEHWRENGVSKMTPLWQLKYLTNMSASHITIYNEFYGPAYDMTLRDASFSAALGEAVETIKSGRADAMLVGSTGSRLHPHRLLEAIKNKEVAVDAQSRPFDANRSGYAPGEGAGAIVLETAESALERGATIYAEVLGGACRGVLKHAKDVDPDKSALPTEAPCDLTFTRESAREAIRNALDSLFKKCGVAPEEIGFVNANARGDVALDAAEALALRDVFGDKLDAIPVASLKGAIGNPGAGGGAIETVAGLISLQDGALFPTLNFETPDPDCPVAPGAQYAAPAGDSFVNICANNLGQASAALFKRWTAPRA